MKTKPQRIELKRLRLINVKKLTPKDLRLNRPVDWETLSANLSEELIDWLISKADNRETFIALKGVLLVLVDGNLRIATEDYEAEEEDATTNVLMINKTETKAPKKGKTKKTRRARLLNTKPTTTKSKSSYGQNAMLKEAKFWIDQINFFMRRECEHLYCEDALYHEDCIMPFQKLINAVYDKVLSSTKSLQKLADFKFSELNDCNSEILNQLCVSSIHDIRYMTMLIKNKCKVGEKAQNIPEVIEAELCGKKEEEKYRYLT